MGMQANGNGRGRFWSAGLTRGTLAPLWRAGLAGMVAGLMATPVAAHPHVFVDAKATIVFDGHGDLIAIRHRWTFDQVFSAWQTLGLDTNHDGVTSSEEMAGLAKSMMKDLAQYRYFTLAGGSGRDLPLASMDDGTLNLDDGRVVLTFGLEPQSPFHVTGDFEVSVWDPEYYTAIRLKDAADVSLSNPPTGCSTELRPPQPLSDDVSARLSSLPPDVRLLPRDLAAALRGAHGLVVVHCGPSTDAAAGGETPSRGSPFVRLPSADNAIPP